MKITDIQGTGVSVLQSDQAGSVESREKTTESLQSSTVDNINVSQQAKVMQRASEIISQTEDVRPEKVDPLMEAVAQGTYGADSLKVANAMIANMIMEH